MDIAAQFNLLIFLVAAFGLLIIGVVLMFVRVYSKLQKLQLELNRENTEIKMEAQKQADMILQSAQKNAQEIIQDANNFNDNAQQIFEKEMQNATQIYAKQYESLLKDVSNKVEKMYLNISESIVGTSKLASQKIDENISQSLSTLSQKIDDEVRSLKNQLADISQQEKERVNKEYDSLKVSRLAKLDDSIKMAVREISQTVMHKSLSEKDHEELILDSLNELKKGGFFNGK